MTWMVRLGMIGSAVLSAGPAQSPGDAGSQATPPPTQCGNQIRALLMAMRIADSSWPDAGRIKNAAAAIKGVISVSIDNEAHALVVTVPEDHRLTESQLVEYLKLAGYTVTPGSDALLDEVAGRLVNGVVSVDASAIQDGPHESKSEAAVPLTSLAESLNPLKEQFNAARGRFRFVALLSPT